MPPLAFALLQFIVSLAAVAGLWTLARKLELGGDPRIADADHARALAEEATCGFDAADVALDRARVGALVRARDGRIMVLRRHGSHFVGRVLDSHARVRLDRDRLVIADGARRPGPVILDLGPEAQAWAASLRRLAPAGTA